MKRIILLTIILASLVLSVNRLQAEVPPMIHYQGFVTVNSQAFTGPGQFKFALVDRAGINSLWSNDGTSVGGLAPASAVTGIPVFKGLYSVLLGDRSVTGMTQAIPTTVFADNRDVFLRVWFDDGVNGLAQLTPDTRIASVGFAMVAAAVSDGVITSDALAPKITLGGDATVGTLTLNSGGDQTRAVLDAGVQNGAASLKLFDATGAFDTVRLVGDENGTGGGQLLLKNGSGNTTLEFDGQDGGSTNAGGIVRFKKNDGATVLALDADIDSGNSGLLLYDVNGAQETVRLTGAQSAARGSALFLRNINGKSTIQLISQETDATTSASVLQMKRDDGAQTVALRSTFGGADGGSLQLANSSGNNTVELAGDGGENQGRMILKASDLANRVRIDADGPNNAGELKLYDSDGTETIQLLGAQSLDQGAVINLRDSDGITTVIIDADDSSEGGRVEVKTGNGNTTGRLQGDIGSGNGGLLLYDANGAESVRFTGSFQGTGAGYLQFRNLAGDVTMSLNGDNNGEGKITTQVLQITGGSDLSEQFDVVAGSTDPEPGMIVCLDAGRPGELRLSDQAYDSTVAGIISGAGGVKPGMLMGQAGTRADGKHPIALTGRVYCWVEASYGAVKTGDLITTSSTPGHGMKANPREAAGAIVGKAITPLKEGKGLVLVLVSLQ